MMETRLWMERIRIFFFICCKWSFILPIVLAEANRNLLNFLLLLVDSWRLNFSGKLRGNCGCIMKILMAEH